MAKLIVRKIRKLNGKRKKKPNLHPLGRPRIYVGKNKNKSTGKKLRLSNRR